MAAGRRVLITGLADGLGSALAARLDGDDRVASITGVDLKDPKLPSGRTSYIRADLSTSSLAAAIDSLGVDTLVHLAITAEPARAGGRSRMKEQNVIGTMQLLAAAQQATNLRRVIIKSTTATYGSNYADPALLREDVIPNTAGSSGYAKDAVEIESYARSFARRRTDVTLTILRFANFIGAGVHSLIGDYLDLPVVPTVLGYDPRVQLCHVFDAVEVLHRSVTEDHHGIFNVAGPGVVYLSQMVRLAGKAGIPIVYPIVAPVAELLRRTGTVDFSPEQVQFLLFGRVGDITRLRNDFSYEPRFSTRTALEDHLRTHHVAPFIPASAIERLEHRILSLLDASRSAERRSS